MILVHLTPFSLKQTFVFEMCLVRSSIANLCPIMSHFNALDFIECRSEEVMFLLMLSVDSWPNSSHLFLSIKKINKLIVMLLCSVYIPL